jgi:chromatin remodeling complex protein RSC6
MINAQMRTYEYYTLGERDEYGQQKLSTNPIGTVKMAINVSSQSIQDNVNYKEAQYIALTQAEVKDTYVIKDNDRGLLKVLYVNSMGRYTQVFLTDYA